MKQQKLTVILQQVKFNLEGALRLIKLIHLSQRGSSTTLPLGIPDLGGSSGMSTTENMQPKPAHLMLYSSKLLTAAAQVSS